MKNFLVNCLVLVLSISLVSCSTNTRNQNTAVGAVTGGAVGGLAGSLVGAGTGQAVAIGAGIVAGALIGGYIGSRMDSSDNTQMYGAMNKPVNHPTTWKNSRSGGTYTMVPTSKMMTVNGNPNCRRYHTTAVMGGKTETTNGIACLQSDGTWRAVR